ncbi:hypothetical protein FOZ63_027645 [Perkinsus olseni]|uniref:Uncharacterized protein n=1 Tax=Perkinsus olseni TaxID=32597 RepID=A0A7J6RHI6_PEROL|nr:hypothetical protein FOZ63_027645 [Perkinsus olseni]
MGNHQTRDIEVSNSAGTEEAYETPAASSQSATKPMMSVNIHGFLDCNEQGEDRSCDERVIVVEFPKPVAELSCGWLVDQAQERFRELGASGHVVGLKEFGNKDDQEAKDSWLMEFKRPLTCLKPHEDLEAIFSVDDLGASSYASKAALTDFEFLKVIGDGASCSVILVMAGACSSSGEWEIIRREDDDQGEDRLEQQENGACDDGTESLG